MSDEERKKNSSKAGKIGGNKCRDEKIGFFDASKEQRTEWRSRGGIKNYQNKKGIWSLSDEERKEACSKGGYITGKRKTPKQQKARRNNVAKLNKTQTCPYCGIVTRGAAYYRYHGEKCKLKGSSLVSSST